MRNRTPIADMVSAMLSAEISAELIVLAIRTTELATRCSDPAADRRRALDRERKRNSVEIEKPLLLTKLLKKDISKKDLKKERGNRISADWTPSAADHSYALAKGMDLGRLATEAEKFRNYWIAKTGVAATKLDWSATWRNWVIQSLERVPAPTAPPVPRGRPDFSKPPDDLEERRAAYMAEHAAYYAQKAKEEANGQGQGEGIRNDAGRDAKRPDRPPKL